jgi:hypothetical protein
MSLPGKWRERLSSRGPATTVDSEARLDAAPAGGLDALESRLSSWSCLWTQESDAAGQSAAQQLVAERLARWMERCFGRHVHNSLRDADNEISLASSTPIFMAFLGRRATRELSRRVLQDI